MGNKGENWRKCVINADSRDIIKRIPDNSIDLILTDPPYNLASHSTGNIPLPGRSAMNNDIAAWDRIDFNPEEWAEDFIRILKPTGNLFIFTSYNQLGRWYNCLDHRFDTSNFMVWHKTNPAPKIFKAGFLNSCELIFTCWNKKHTWNFISQAEMHNFIQSPICMAPERLQNPKHPAQKPITILKKIIEIASNSNDIIFDPFMGVGSTGVAALDLGRRFIGIELDADYFQAARNRINQSLNKTAQKPPMTKAYQPNNEDETTAVYEGIATYNATTRQLADFFNQPLPPTQTAGIQPQLSPASGLSPIIKWPGGKEKELKYIIPNLPNFERFFEPFVGGGAVFMGINAHAYHINDRSEELMDLYRYIASMEEAFFAYARDIDLSWRRATTFAAQNESLRTTYEDFRNDKIDAKQLKEFIQTFCRDNKNEIIGLLTDAFAALPCVLVAETEKNLWRKMTRMRQLEQSRHLLPEKDLQDNIETAIKSALYMNYRHLYNVMKETDRPLRCALFFFLRNYAYSSMFRYSNKGDFNVPYGGIAYNGKLMAKKLDYYQTEALQNHFKATRLYNLDFEDFLTQVRPQANDFVFLDPPYDSEFSTYAQNCFTADDQVRLANYLLHECKAKWMLIIKNTDFIFQLYNQKGVNIRAFDKEYAVSFMNRNKKQTTHLLITNYDN